VKNVRDRSLTPLEVAMDAFEVDPRPIDGGGAVAGRRQAGCVADEIIHAEIAQRHAKVLRGDVFELVRLIDDERGARGDDLAVLALADRRIGAQQVMVDDDDIRLRGALAHLRHEAVAVPRTLGAETRLRLGGDVLPERQVFGKIPQLRPVSRLRVAQPGVDDGKQHAVAGVDQGSGLDLGSVSVQLVAVQAEIVRAPLHQRCREGDVPAPPAGRGRSLK
jgi:hypothetical protein